MDIKDIRKAIDRVGNLELKDDSFVADNQDFDNLARYANNLTRIINKIFSSQESVKAIIECSPECCPLCHKDSECDGSIKICRKYHLSDMQRIMQNLKKQGENQ